MINVKKLRKIRIHSPRVVVIVAVLLISISGLPSVHSQTYNISDAEEFAKIVDTENAVLTTNATVPGPLLEGPVWIPEEGGYLIFSAMDSENKLKKLVAPFGQANLSDFYSPPPNTIYNGNTLDNDGRLISAQAGSAGLKVVMTSLVDTSVTTLASLSENQLQFLSPNDVVVKSDGTIWFTDPAFNSGFDVGSPGHETSRGVYRFHPEDGDGTAVKVRRYFSPARPNGLCFSPDESILWVADWDGPYIQGLTVLPDNTIPIRGAVVKSFSPPSGNPDGIRCDVDGRVWAS